MEKRIALVVNPLPENQRTRLLAAEIRQSLKEKGISFSSFDQEWPGSFEGFSEVWIAGGDGTLNYFINKYKDLALPLSLFRGGSGNDFHWMLYGDCTVEEQVQRVLDGQIIKVDAGVVNGMLFLNGVGIGFDGAIVKDLLGRKKVAGKATYLLSIMKHIIGYRETGCRIKLKDNLVDQDCFMISIANGSRYGGGFHVAPRAILKDGLLDINIVGAISPLKRMRYLPVIEKGQHLDLPFIHYFQETSVVIESAAEMDAHADGEYFRTDLFEISVLPAHIPFLV